MKKITWTHLDPIIDINPREVANICKRLDEACNNIRKRASLSNILTLRDMIERNKYLQLKAIEHRNSRHRYRVLMSAYYKTLIIIELIKKDIEINNVGLYEAKAIAENINDESGKQNKACTKMQPALERGYTLKQITEAIQDQWLYDYNGLRNTEPANAYFMVGFVLEALKRIK